jgi:glutamine synthetase
MNPLGGAPMFGLDELADAGIRTVIVTSADVTGRLVGKRFGTDVFRKLVHEGVPLSSCVLGWDFDQWPGPTQSYTGHHTGWHDVRLVPDLSTLRPAAWLESTAICVADFVEMGRDDLVEVAPRTVLRRQIERFETDGFTPQVASELELSLYRGTYDEGRTNGYETLMPTTLARADYTVQAGDQHEAFFSQVREALTRSNLGPYTSQVEWGLGQWEINLEYRSALEMADRHMLFKLAMRDLAAANGMAATFMAKPFPDTTGSSCHLHLSLLDGEGVNVFGQGPSGEGEDASGDAEGSSGDGEGASGNTLAAPLRAAVGGVLAHANDLMAFYAPTINSYRRIAGGEFSGNGLSWGYDTRMVSCRVLVEAPESTRLEWRVPGADVNPYLAIAALLASARDGIARNTDPGEPLVGEDWQREVPPLPAHLGEAVAAFRESAWTTEVFGPDVVSHYSEAGRWEWDRFLAADAVTEWERRRYFEFI